MKAKEDMMKKADYVLMFIDSPDYFLVENAKMIFENQMVRFICFNGDEFKENIWFPITRIFRIKRYTF